MTQKHIQSIPVVRASSREYELAALVGDGAVILGWTMADNIDRSDLLGFGIRRVCRDAATQQETECRWLSNHRRFAPRGDTIDHSEISTHSDPLQQFFFLDYEIDKGHTYTYSVVPVRGTPTLKYFEAPITVTVNPANSKGTVTSATGSGNDQFMLHEDETPAHRSTFVVGPNARQAFHSMSVSELALNIQRHAEQARSAVFLYSTTPLPEEVLSVVRQVNSGRLLYGLVPRQAGEADSPRRSRNTVHLSQPVTTQRLDPLTFRNHGGPDIRRFTTALVTDPWSRSPEILLWSDAPRASATRTVDTQLITRDKRCAARLATLIFQAYTAGRLPSATDAARISTGAPRNLEPDGRWSNIYFSRHAASHKYREREIFSGHP